MTQKTLTERAMLAYQEAQRKNDEANRAYHTRILYKLLQDYLDLNPNEVSIVQRRGVWFAYIGNLYFSDGSVKNLQLALLCASCDSIVVLWTVNSLVTLGRALKEYHRLSGVCKTCGRGISPTSHSSNLDT